MAENYVVSAIDAPVPLGEPNDNVQGRFVSLLFQTTSNAPTTTDYYLMEAYDTAALIWRSWVATGAPDPTASQYPGPPFPFTIVSVLRKWTA